MNFLQNIAHSLLYDMYNPLEYTSVFFIFIFTIFYGIYIRVFNNVKKRNFILLIFSLYFYYKISGLYLILLIVMASSDFFIGKAMFNPKTINNKKLLMVLSIVINAGLLVLFKYTNFILYSFFEITFKEPSPIILNLIMPIGISFYMFKTLSYIFDIYRDVIEKPEKSYLNYLLYVSFFPNILAGPISKARDLIPQLDEKLNISSELISKGLFLIMCGAFKKIVIADVLGGNLVNRVFESPEFFSGFEGLMAMYGYTMQIYFDFSGYTDIVIGISALLGFNILPNFNKPFLAKNVSDFWRRWHMTLTSWLNEYLFFPLSYTFRKLKNFGIIIAVLITFFISGVWHGPSWTYIFWGLSHGVAIAYGIASENIRLKISQSIPKKVYDFLSIFITFQFLSLSMVLFRSSSLQNAFDIYNLIFNNFDVSIIAPWFLAYYKPFIFMVLAFALHYTPIKYTVLLQNYFDRLNWLKKSIVITLVIIIIYQAFGSSAQPFIYLAF